MLMKEILFSLLIVSEPNRRRAFLQFHLLYFMWDIVQELYPAW